MRRTYAEYRAMLWKRRVLAILRDNWPWYVTFATLCYLAGWLTR